MNYKKLLDQVEKLTAEYRNYSSKAFEFEFCVKLYGLINQFIEESKQEISIFTLECLVNSAKKEGELSHDKRAL